MKRMSYAEAGVDIDAEEQAVAGIVSAVGDTEAVHLDGHRLVMCTDGVGSKVIVADEMRRWDTVGIDCMAMNVNDALCMGARPLAFVDYLAMEQTDEQKAADIARGLRRGADQAGIPILGGETATLPEVIRGFDLAGTCVAVVEHELPRDIRSGDVIIGLRSSGLHSNGYTLARKVFTENGYDYHETLPGTREAIGDALLEPTRIYVRETLALWDEIDVRGISHVTGGGLRNLKRLSSDVCFSIDEPFEPQHVFQVVQELGNVADREMYQTFNMGMGLALVVGPADVGSALDMLARHSDMDAKIVGHVTEGAGVELPDLELRY
jgi:phosphoribosylformylglycinamidine cyclo-ligase